MEDAIAGSLRWPLGVDTPDNGSRRARRDVEVGRQSLYTEEFRKDAVALYRAADGKRTYAAVAADVGISGETLRTWVRKDTARNGRSQDRSTGADGTEADELARLRAENARLRGAEKEWQLEREILRRAAAYFAKEVK
ncbi:transposase [Rhodococcus koreensis]|uniref:Transposase n=1 Tax=Rhodococcus koreensis TaxID=99653 RepID=A0A1H4IB57_9NOCA|nr:transposase [Rhodococcus koreensis]